MKNFPGNFQVGVVVGGDVNDPAPDQSGNMKVWSPTEHNPDNYPKDSLPFATIVQPATKSQQQEFSGPPDPSSMVLIMKTEGGAPIVLGQIRDFVNPNQSTSGNDNRMMHGIQNVYNVWDQGLGMNKPAKIVEKVVDGVKIRQRENPQEYKPSDIAGLPNHAALFNMAGHKWPQVQNIETAIQHFNQIVTGAMAGQLPGQLSSLAGLLKGLSGGQKQQIQQSVPPSVYNAIESMANVIPETEIAEDYVSDFRVDPETFANNAVNLLCQCTTIGDLNEALHIIETDESIRGLEKLQNVTITVEGPFGNTSLILSANGNTSFTASNTYTQQTQSFSNFLGSASSAPGVNLGSNMFGQASKTISDMIQRVPPQVQAQLKTMLERVNKGDAGPDNAKVTSENQTGGGQPIAVATILGLSP